MASISGTEDIVSVDIIQDIAYDSAIVVYLTPGLDVFECYVYINNTVMFHVSVYVWRWYLLLLSRLPNVYSYEQPYISKRLEKLMMT